MKYYKTKLKWVLLNVSFVNFTKKNQINITYSHQWSTAYSFGILVIFSIKPSKDTSTDHRGIRPSLNTSTYRHRDVGYGHSSNYDNVHGVQHCFITPGQHRHIRIISPEYNPVYFLTVVLFQSRS